MTKYLGKYSVNNPVGQCMVAISYKVLFINQKIMICVQLPEFAIYYIEMLVREISVETKSNHINFT